jgi:hypothetical protein
MRRLAAFTLLTIAACTTSEPMGPDPEAKAESRADALELSGAQIPMESTAPVAEGSPEFRFNEYQAVIDKVAGMSGSEGLYSRVQARGLDLLDIAWEDTGRAEGSALGPNITDLTLQVRNKDPQGNWHTALMPVIRFPNFSDRTGDIPADRFFARVGNQKDSGDELETVALTDVLDSLRSYASKPDDIKGSGNMRAQRDTHFLVSAQAVFLPIPRHGQAEFNPVLFNYQSAPGSPAVLSMLITRQGTSMHVIENRPDQQSVAGWGQEVYFNNRGQRSAFTAERRSDVVARIEAQGGPITEDDKTAIQKGADVIFLVQIPLKHYSRGVLGGLDAPYKPAPKSMADMSSFGLGESAKAAPSATSPMGGGLAAQARSDIETAVVGHGPNLGPFSEAHGLSLVRDPAFPVRITVQFYKATSNGVVSSEDLDAIKKSIDDVYKHADYVGSLVVPRGDAKRPTSWQTMPNQWFPW